MDLEDFEKNILSFNDEPDLNIQIKPNYYIHMALLMAQRTLMVSLLKQGVQDGILVYSIFIEHIEVLSRSGGLLSSDYGQKLSAYMSSPEYTSIEKKDIAMARLANRKLEYLMSEIFGRSPINSPLRITKKSLYDDEKPAEGGALDDLD